MSLEEDSPLNALCEFAEALEDLKIPYFIGGSFASSAHGEYRTTNDIDFVCKLNTKTLDKLHQALKDTFVFDINMANDALSRGASFNIFHDKSLSKIDIFTNIDEFQEEEFLRAIPIEVPGTEIKVMIASPEDTILSKIVWYKKGNMVSDQQWRDIKGVIRIQGNKLDQNYLQDQAQKLKIKDLLLKALEE